MTALQPFVTGNDHIDAHFNGDHSNGDNINGDEEMNAHDEYGQMMSLALDDLLESQETARLESHLAECARCRDRWRLWQALDGALQAAPMTDPSPGFVLNFGRQLASQERKRRVRLGILLGALTLVMWLVGVAGVSLVFGALIYNQVSWFTETLHWLAYVWTAVTVVGNSLLALLGGLFEAPSGLGIVAGYVVFAGGILLMWSRYLRRSLQMIEIG